MKLSGPKFIIEAYLTIWYVIQNYQCRFTSRHQHIMKEIYIYKKNRNTMAQTVHTCIVALGVGPCMFTYNINHTYSFTVWHTGIVTLQRTFSNSTWNISVTQYYTSYHLWYKVTIKIKRIPLFMDCELFSESCYMLGNCLKFFY